MLNVGPTTGAAVAGAEFIKNEILRVGAPEKDLRSALNFLMSSASLDPRAYEALPPRMRRLVDLLAVAGDGAISLVATSVAPDPAVA